MGWWADLCSGLTQKKVISIMPQEVHTAYFPDGIHDADEESGDEAAHPPVYSW